MVREKVESAVVYQNCNAVQGQGSSRLLICCLPRCGEFFCLLFICSFAPCSEAADLRISRAFLSQGLFFGRLRGVMLVCLPACCHVDTRGRLPCWSVAGPMAVGAMITLRGEDYSKVSNSRRDRSHGENGSNRHPSTKRDSAMSPPHACFSEAIGTVSIVFACVLLSCHHRTYVETGGEIWVGRTKASCFSQVDSAVARKNSR